MSGTLPTDFGFTGQRNQSTIGLYDYHARFYDPRIGRFVSADTIVPSPSNPQALNRYAYVYNNPLRHIDPSGHGLKEYLEKLARKAGRALAQGWSNFTTGVEALKGIATYGPYLVYPDNFCLGPMGCWGGIEYARSMYAESTHQRRKYEGIFAKKVFNIYSDDRGRPTDSVSALIAISDYVAHFTESTNDYVNDMSLLILGFEHVAGGVLPVVDRQAGLPFNSTGFGSFYGDPSITNNQVNHFWFFVHAGYQFGATEEGIREGGMDMLYWLAELHEMDVPFVGAAGGGGSIQDYRLSLLGINVGIALRLGILQPDQLGNWLDYALGHSLDE